MLKKEECAHHNIAWGTLIAAFGVFFLIANLSPSCGIMAYWPIFLILAGGLKVFFGCWTHMCGR